MITPSEFDRFVGERLSDVSDELYRMGVEHRIVVHLVIPSEGLGIPGTLVEENPHRLNVWLDEDRAIYRLTMG